ncbi:hypothetical protein ACHAPU_010902 [Fusarium lateritium]
MGGPPASMLGFETPSHDCVRSKLQPNREAIFSLVWNWSRALAGLEVRTCSTCATNTTEVPLVCLLETEGNIIKGLQGAADLRVFRRRGHAILLAKAYEELAAKDDNILFPQAMTDWLHGSTWRHGQHFHHQVKDPILDKMTRDLFNLDPRYEFNPEDPKRTNVDGWLHVGLVLQALVKKMDWAAVLIIGIQLTDDEYAWHPLHLLLT